MTSKLKIQLHYKTERGTELPSYEEAVIADCLEKMENVYLDTWKVKEIATALNDYFLFSEREILVEEENNETI